MNYEQAIKELQDNLVVIAEIEKRQSALLKEHSQHIGELMQYRRRIDQILGLLKFARPLPLVAALNGAENTDH